MNDMKKGDKVLIEMRGPRGGKRKPQWFEIVATAKSPSTKKPTKRRRQKQ